MCTAGEPTPGKLFRFPHEKGCLKDILHAIHLCITVVMMVRDVIVTVYFVSKQVVCVSQFNSVLTVDSGVSW